MPSRSIRDAKQFGAPMGSEDPGNTTTSRRQAGPADDTTRKAAIAARNAEREPRQATPSPKTYDNPTKDLSIATAVDRIKTRKLAIDKALDE